MVKLFKLVKFLELLLSDYMLGYIEKYKLIQDYEHVVSCT